MNTPTAYTPLECLLLFQSLAAFGVEEDSFTQISDLLTHNALVKDGETYDPTRLGPDALRDLYLQLLREESKAEHDGQQNSSQPTSKKRKIQSPASSTIKDAQEDKEKLPQLVERLYARYRDHIVRGIREDERQYADLQREIEELEKEENERILEEAPAHRNGSLSPNRRPKTNGASSTLPTLKDKAAETVSKISQPLASPHTGKHDAQVINDIVSNRAPPPQPSPSLDQRTPNSSIAPPNQYPRPHGPSPLQPPQQPGVAYKWEPPYQVGPPHPQYQQGPYPPYNPSQYSQQGYTPRGAYPGPHGVPPHLQVPSSPLNGQSPVLLPPPGAALPSSGSPGMPLDALADMAGQQQYRAPSGSPMQQQGPFTPGGYAPPYPPPQQQQQRQGSGPMPPAQWNQQYPPAYQGSPQQYFQPPPMNQISPFPPRSDLPPTENRQYNSPYNPGQGPKPQMQASTPRPYYPGTPIGQGPFTQTPGTTGSGTRWTFQPLTASTPPPYTSLQPPPVEPLSPVLRPSKSLSGKKSTTILEVAKPKGKPGPKPKRGAQRTRVGSNPSLLGGSRRSVSVASPGDHPDELSLDIGVKEEAATPRPLPDEETGDTTADDASLPPPRRLGRPPKSSNSNLKRKRGKSDSLPVQTPVISTIHRDFAARTAAEHEDEVLYTRSFPRISAAALSAIITHRHASLFSVPIKDRDAPGYHSIILRAQDLKSIKAAIKNGERAAIEIEKTMLVDKKSGEDEVREAQVYLPISEDLIPPKGIINFTQLEKELMRMFANAVMFNPDPNRGFGEHFQFLTHEDHEGVKGTGKKGDAEAKGKKGGDGYEFDEDGVVRDALDMQAEVEGILQGLRSAEHVSTPIHTPVPRAGGSSIRGAADGKEIRGSSVRGGSSVRRGSSVGQSGPGRRGAGSVRGSSVATATATATEDEIDELAGDGEPNVAASLPKRRRRG
jgi:hypothetical protein